MSLPLSLFSFFKVFGVIGAFSLSVLPTLTLWFVWKDTSQSGRVEDHYIGRIARTAKFLGIENSPLEGFFGTRESIYFLAKNIMLYFIT